jgi:biotin carboxyl carrier protein
MQIYHITLNGTTFVVEVLGDPTQDEVQVRVDGETLQVRVGDAEHAPPPTGAPAPLPSSAPSPAPASPPPAPLGGNGSQLIAPLPGTVISVSVQTGQRVNAGDDLLVIEAMKMNNRIRSPRSGTVGEVLVQVGQQVGHGAPLLAWSD